MNVKVYILAISAVAVGFAELIVGGIALGQTSSVSSYGLGWSWHCHHCSAMCSIFFNQIRCGSRSDSESE